MAGMGRSWAVVVGITIGAIVLVGVAIVGADEGRVVGTKHDVATRGTPVCVYCHIPKSPTGEPLWTTEPNSVGSFSGAKPLCFSCHDGTVAASSYNYVFDLSRPEHPREPGVRGQDCDRCHDPHKTGYGEFLKVPGGANFCQACHLLAGPVNHPTDVDAAAAGHAPADSEWDPRAGDFSGTRLWDPEGLEPGQQVKCLTCHSPHGAQPGTEINTVPLDASPGTSRSLCESCHDGR